MLRRLIAPLLAMLGAVGVLAFGEYADQPSQTAPQAVLVRRAQNQQSFAQLIDRLSESDRYFDTDNLITNERSYLHVMDKLEQLDVSGGAYIGVGPGQNFSYVAQVEPSIAFMIDIRRDNLLQHLLYKALFELADNRMEFLCLWLGRSCPADAARWTDRSLPDLVRYIDDIRPDPAVAATAIRRIRQAVTSYGVPLTNDDVAKVDRFHREFIRLGLSLRFTSHGRAPLPDYPTLRQLLLEKDLDGDHQHYLASEDRFRLIKSLQDQDLIVPVVGDLAGTHALVEIGRWLEEHQDTVSAFYTSNVEFYLVRQGDFEQFIHNVSALPTDERSLIIRSYFNRGFRSRHPHSVTGYSSTQLLQTVEHLLNDYSSGGLQSYWDLVTRNAIALR